MGATIVDKTLRAEIEGLKRILKCLIVLVEATTISNHETGFVTLVATKFTCQVRFIDIIGGWAPLWTSSSS